MSRGKVWLVGAGPGAPDLITLRGAEALRRADAVVYDALASPRLLELAPPEADRIDVGRRGHDAPTRSQPEITALLVELASAGRRVVRLKGGDPYVFGRGGEEASALAAAGIPFEVVPGVSSALGALAYAGIPLTDRRHSASFAVVTGHSDPTVVSRETRWDLLARGPDTLVILMGMRNLRELLGRLEAAGRPGATPAAAVMSGTHPEQHVVSSTLAGLADAVESAGLGSPAVVVVGEVVGLRETLSWWERQPLFGRRVLVTRSREQAGAFVDALAAEGARAVCAPMIQLEAPADCSELDAALEDLGAYTQLVFTSANAVRFSAARARARGLELRPGPATRVICVGPATARAALEGPGCPSTACRRPSTMPRRCWKGLLRDGDLAGQRVLIPRSDLARDTLPEGLRAAGARVDAVVAYRNLPAAIDAEALRRQLLAGELDALTFASPSAVRRFAALLDAQALAAARRCVVAAIGPVTARALERAGLPAAAVAGSATPAALVEALAAAL